MHDYGRFKTNGCGSDAQMLCDLNCHFFDGSDLVAERMSCNSRFLPLGNNRCQWVWSDGRAEAADG
jgi:hypothetical protein